MTTLFLKLLAVSSLLLAGAAPQPTKIERDAAASWASQNRQEAFDAVMPNALTDAVGMPTCRVTTLRVSGSFDTFEYAVRVVEPCPVVNEHGIVEKSRPTGEFVIAEGSPITDQLARIRLRSPEIAPEAAISSLRVRRFKVSAKEAENLVSALSEALVPMLPPTDIALDTPTYELASATGITQRAIELTSASKGRGERRIMQVAAQIAAAHGFDGKRLRYDASYWD